MLNAHRFLPAVLLSVVACRSEPEGTGRPDPASSAPAKASTTAKASAAASAKPSASGAGVNADGVDGDGGKPRSTPFVAVAKRNSDATLHLVDGKIIATAGPTFYEVTADAEFKRIPEMSAGLPRNDFREAAPDVSALTGHAPDALFATLNERNAGGRVTEIKSVYQWDGAKKSWKPARSPGVPDTQLGYFYFRDLTTYKDGAVVATLGLRTFSSGDTSFQALDTELAKAPAFVVVSGGSAAPQVPRGFCVDDSLGTKSGDFFVAGRKCGEKKISVRKAGAADPLPPLPFDVEDATPQIAGAAPDDLYVWAGAKVAHYDGKAWTAVALKRSGALRNVQALAGGVAYFFVDNSDDGGLVIIRRGQDGALTEMLTPDNTFYNSMLALADGDVWLANSQGMRGSATILYRSKPGARPVFTFPTAADVDAEAADRDPPEPLGKACSGATFTFVKEIPDGAPKPYDFADLAALVKASPDTAGDYVEIVWRGKRYTGIDEQRFGPKRRGHQVRAPEARQAQGDDPPGSILPVLSEGRAVGGHRQGRCGKG